MDEKRLLALAPGLLVPHVRHWTPDAIQRRAHPPALSLAQGTRRSALHCRDSQATLRQSSR